MQAITPHLWFDTQAKEAVELYVSVFPDSKITHFSVLKDTPSGDCDILSFELAGQPFMAISAGPYFQLNPSISFHVRCATKEEVDEIWGKLIDGGTALMELGEYPFSKHYGWLQDKYGLSWQIMYMDGQPVGQKIVPALTFVGDVAGHAQEAIDQYIAIFNDAPFAAKKESGIAFTNRYGTGMEPDKEGTVQYAQIALNGMDFVFMDSAHDHKFAFNEAVSLLVPCENQEEVDYFWEKLSTDPEAEQCGWCKDAFGVSWQVWPVELGEMMENGTPEQVARVTKAFMEMKKFDIAKLKEAFEGGE